MKKILFVLTVLAAIAACQPISEYPTPPGYAASVAWQDPVYCYRGFGDQTTVTCYATPYHRDSRRFVNYYGAPPTQYEPPPPPPALKLVAPQPAAYWVKDPEPVPRANPPGN